MQILGAQWEAYIARAEIVNPVKPNSCSFAVRTDEETCAQVKMEGEIGVRGRRLAWSDIQKKTFNHDRYGTADTTL